MLCCPSIGSASPGGLGAKFNGQHPLGGEFKTVETGHTDNIALSLDETARKLVQQRLEGESEIHILIVPDDEAVAATYFGAG